MLNNTTNDTLAVIGGFVLIGYFQKICKNVSVSAHNKTLKYAKFDWCFGK